MLLAAADDLLEGLLLPSLVIDKAAMATTRRREITAIRPHEKDCLLLLEPHLQNLFFKPHLGHLAFRLILAMTASCLG